MMQIVDPQTASDTLFLAGFPAYFSSWREFHSELEQFSEKTWQLFSLRTCKAVAARNHQIEPEWATNRRNRVHCLPSGSTIRRRFCAPTACPTSLVVVACATTMSFATSSASRESTRPWLKCHLYEHYVERRRVVDRELLQEAENMMLAGAKSRGICKYLKEQTGKKVTLKAVHNFITRCKHKASRDSADVCTERLLREFCQASGNTATVFVDDSNVLQTLVFQTKAMKKMFAAFSEVLFVDSTFGTNANHHSLLGFACQDVFGKLNPASKNVRVVVTDKDETLIRVLKTHFPKARFLLCQFHVIQYLDKQVVALFDNIKAIMASLVYAKDESDYLASRRLLLRMCDNNEEHNLFSYFVKNWDSDRERWAAYLRGTPNINSPRACPNRLESRWGKLKDIIEPYDCMDDCKNTLFQLLQGCEDQYIALLGKIGRRVVLAGESDDAELQQLAGALSVYACKLVVPEYKIGI
ncbi:TPA: hypothetical protein N0F65_000947 [Lagenidium giganteum]|uniref:ZSWIM1/3 RNaseH-like domain-containing protein n=1 Tax=Lagenidium giganteum TaxID=4803 RepID=A0AAV2YJA4_9STRA|nr:TPA: hypothetical protein N0F65_000947 [Lagenidium giganteum]